MGIGFALDSRHSPGSEIGMGVRM